MSLSETRNLRQQSRKVTSILNMILNLVSSIDKRQKTKDYKVLKNVLENLTK